ncbi:Clavaminate synthase-like protein [Aspergillus aculeatinus CBS 121060]|uniref:Clavaminate synthase-like protein n=1 Tax=Aspergillus aculeatinus CBS 121060 TaxID=1448322 RepID=A0ACD1HFL7_9EURO|nr:Clavaminate synthase-like protein [Aspergillus aculeatinus CBS 121060]RAH72161.1 Clavaminate synthase-like protein [Aspergillus aculeatinus CBS 121060]
MATTTVSPNTYTPLRSVSLDQLLAKDPESIQELLQGARSPGFFLVDLRGVAGKQIRADLAQVYQVTKDYFDQPSQAKQEHFRADIDRGQEKKKNSNINPQIQLAREELASSQLACPGQLATHKELLARFTADCHDLALTLVRNLSDMLGLAGDAHLETSHSDTQSNDSGLKLIEIPTVERMDEFPDTTHTDNGTLTLLWSTEMASQICDPITGEWGWAEERDGHVLVNVANSLQKQTGGRLHSCLHKVAQPSDGAHERYMVSYYLRPSAK